MLGPPAEGPRGGGPPAEGPRGGGGARQGAPWGGRARRGAWVRIHWGGDTQKDYTKPRQTIQSPGILDKAPETLYKDPKDYTKT